MTLSAFAPGRVELLGNHTDYNEGVVLSAALDLGITVTGHARDDEALLLSSVGMEDVAARLEDLRPTGSWADYPLGVVSMFLGAGARIPGFEAHFSATLPLGSGLSSSAAIEIATAIFLVRLSGFSMRPLDLARLCRRAENEFVGVQCGLLDQVSSLLGERDRVIHLDCRAESVRTIPFLPNVPNASLIIINSGVQHALTGGEYNERRESCFEAAARLGVPALRDATLEQLDRAGLPDRIRRRAAHVIGENLRVARAVEALHEGDACRLGALMTESHESSRVNFENSAPELDALVGIATARNDIWGARLTGGGFGGSIVALASEDQPGRAAVEIIAAYRDRTGHQGTALVCRPGAGAWEANGLDGADAGSGGQ